MSESFGGDVLVLIDGVPRRVNLDDVRQEARRTAERMLAERERADHLNRMMVVERNGPTDPPRLNRAERRACTARARGRL